VGAPSTSTSGGSLAAATYFYVVTAVDASGETTISNEVSIATTGSTSSVTLTWPVVAGATGYRVYRGTSAGTEGTRYTAASSPFTDTGAAGTAASPPGANTTSYAYTTNADERWSFLQSGERVMATNFLDPIQSFVMNASSVFADLAAAAPKARYLARVSDSFVMAANTFDPVSGAVPQRVWWAAIGDPTTWPTPGSATAAQLQSDYRDLIGDGGWSMGIVGGLSGADAAIFQERNVWRAMYIGPPVIFSFKPVENARGTPAPGSIVSLGPVVYYLADDGFYMFDGIQSTPIGAQKVDNHFYGEVDQSYMYRITSAVDPLNKLIYWSYPGPQNVGGTPNRILVYNYALGRWSKIEQTVEAMVPRAFTTGYTLEQLDAFGTLETLPYTLDSRAWTGGKLNLAAFGTDHAMGFFSGAPLAATMETSEANLNKRGLTHISRTYPIIDTAAAEVALGMRMKLSDPVTWGPATGQTSTTGSCPARSTGMYHRARITVPAGVPWNHAQGLEADGRAAGRR
jgi:hypothetical protein